VLFGNRHVPLPRQKREHPTNSNRAAIVDRLLTILALRCDNVIVTETGQVPIGRDEALKRISAAGYPRSSHNRGHQSFGDG
jgi:hypothetical protein